MEAIEQYKALHQQFNALDQSLLSAYKQLVNDPLKCLETLERLQPQYAQCNDVAQQLRNQYPELKQAGWPGLGLELTHAEIYSLKAKAYRLAGLTHAASKELDKALKICPQDHHLYIQLLSDSGHIRKELGMLDEAETLFKKALKEGQFWTDPQNWTGVVPAGHEANSAAQMYRELLTFRSDINHIELLSNRFNNYVRATNELIDDLVQSQLIDRAISEWRYFMLSHILRDKEKIILSTMGNTVRKFDQFLKPYCPESLLPFWETDQLKDEKLKLGIDHAQSTQNEYLWKRLLEKLKQELGEIDPNDQFKKQPLEYSAEYLLSYGSQEELEVAIEEYAALIKDTNVPDIVADRLLQLTSFCNKAGKWEFFAASAEQSLERFEAINPISKAIMQMYIADGYRQMGDPEKGLSVLSDTKEPQDIQEQLRYYDIKAMLLFAKKDFTSLLKLDLKKIELIEAYFKATQLREGERFSPYLFNYYEVAALNDARYSKGENVADLIFKSRHFSWEANKAGVPIKHGLVSAEKLAAFNSNIHQILNREHAVVLQFISMGAYATIILTTAEKNTPRPLTVRYSKAERDLLNWEDSDWGSEEMITQKLGLSQAFFDRENVRNFLSKAIGQAKNLIIVPDEFWLNMPFSGIEVLGKKLADYFEAITYLPSIHLLEEAVVHSGKTSIAIGTGSEHVDGIDTYFRDFLPRVFPGEGVGKIMDEDTPVTKDVVIEALREADDFFIASHGQEKNPEVCPDSLAAVELVLSEDKATGAREVLRARELYECTFPMPERVFLCACMSGRSRPVSHVAVGGFVQAFLAGGTRSMVSSIASIDPRVATEVARLFYGGGSDKTPRLAAGLNNALKQFRIANPNSTEWLKYVHWGWL